MTLGEKIKELRIKSNLTQEQLAEELDLSRSAVAKWESNNGLPDIVNLKKLSKIFSVTIDSLVDYNEDVKIRENLNDEEQSENHYIGKLCDIELEGWNDGTINSYILNEDNNFLFYKYCNKKKDIYGCLSKYLIVEIDIKESENAIPTEIDNKIDLDYFINKAVDIEFVKRGLVKGFFDFRDDDFMNVVIKAIDSESITLEFGKKIDIVDICKIEICDEN